MENMDKLSKKCNFCKKNLELNMFHKNGTSIRSECKYCINQKRKEYRLKNRDIVNQRQRNYTRNNPDKIRNMSLKKLYAISLKEKQKMEKDQGYCCAICKQRKPLFVDHNHDSNFIRGLLCSNCNLGLGQFKDSKRRLYNALKYLENDITSY